MIKIYPNTTFSMNSEIGTTNYNVVTLIEYFKDFEIDLFYVKEVLVTNTSDEAFSIDPNLTNIIYLGYTNNSREITLIFRNDLSMNSWISNVKSVTPIFKETKPMWEEEY